MRVQRLSALIVVTSLSAFLIGCDKPAEVVSCEDLDKISDSLQRAEILKRCPHSGATFKPSPVKSY